MQQSLFLEEKSVTVQLK